MNFSVSVYSSTRKHCHRSWAVRSLSSVAVEDFLNQPSSERGTLRRSADVFRGPSDQV